MGLLMWGALSRERSDLQFSVVAGRRQRSHFQVCAPRDSWPYFIVSILRLPQLGGPGSCIYIPQEQSKAVSPSRTIIRHLSQQTLYCCDICCLPSWCITIAHCMFTSCVVKGLCWPPSSCLEQICKQYALFLALEALNYDALTVSLSYTLWRPL
jgi:hypothetical protein